MIRIVMLFYFSVHLSVIFVHAQGPKIKFGDISPRDFAVTRYAVDTGASAVILADIGTSYFEGTNNSSIALYYKQHRRVHVLNKNGFDIGKVEIQIYSSDGIEEELENLNAVTYNLEDGKVIETKLDIKTSLFKDKINKNWVVKKFTFPNLKVGSIIEYELIIKSNYFFNLRSWEFQGNVPRLWSEYTANVPSFINYITFVQNYESFFVNEQNDSRKTFNIIENNDLLKSNMFSFNAATRENKWVMKDVPAIKKENFISTISNHVAKLEFQLFGYSKPYVEKRVMSSWEETAKFLLNSSDFGYELNMENGWMKNELKEAIDNASDPMQQVRNIYYWVQKNVTWNGMYSTELSHPLKNVMKDKAGNVAEVNLLLVAMLRKAGYAADPVLLSTRSHGYTHPDYPLINKYNYVICRVSNGDNPIYLDATNPRLGFNKLDYECYNSYARIINDSAKSLELNPDSLKETNATTIILINDEKGNALGGITKKAGYFESCDIRDDINDNGKDDFLKKLKKEYSNDIEITSIRIDSLNNFELPTTYNLEFNWNPVKADIIYVNPLFGNGYKENPFKSTQRAFPVEMPYTKDEIISMNMEIPAGYVVDELPKQAMIKLNDKNDIVYEYRISSSGSSVKLISRLKINKTLFMPEEYENLRDFFGFIVNKQAEQIVFRKKNRQ